MADYKAELDDAVANLDRHFDELKQSAARRLGSLFNASDYPETLIGLFGVSFDFPAIEPPDYLVRLTPGLYEREQERVRARFEEAVRLAEQAFLDQFAAVVTHLTERITGTNDDGTPKVFRDSAVDEPGRVLRAIPLAERPDPTSSSTTWSPRRSGPCGTSGRRTFATARPRAAGGHPALAGAGVAGRDAGRPAAAADPPQRPGVGGRVMKLLVKPDGTVRAIYDEAIDLGVLGRPTITRASHVEPDEQGRWTGRPDAGGRPACSGRSTAAARPWRPSATGWNATGSSIPTEPHVPSSTPSPRPASGRTFLSPPRTITPRPAPPCPLLVRRPRGRCAGSGGTGPEREEALMTRTQLNHLDRRPHRRVARRDPPPRFPAQVEPDRGAGRRGDPPRRPLPVLPRPGPVSRPVPRRLGPPWPSATAATSTSRSTTATSSRPARDGSPAPRPLATATSRPDRRRTPDRRIPHRSPPRSHPPRSPAS